MPIELEETQDNLLVVARCEPCQLPTQHGITLKEGPGRASLRAACFACGAVTILDQDESEGGGQR